VLPGIRRYTDDRSRPAEAEAQVADANPR